MEKENCPYSPKCCTVVQIILSTTTLIIAAAEIVWGVVSKLHFAGYLGVNYVTETVMTIATVFEDAAFLGRLSPIALIISGSALTFHLVMFECWNAMPMKHGYGGRRKFKIFVHVTYCAEVLVCFIVASLCMFGKEFIAFNINAYMAQAVENVDKTSSSGIEVYQEFFGCCGAQNMTDWTSNSLLAPESCCILPATNCTGALHFTTTADISQDSTPFTEDNALLEPTTESDSSTNSMQNVVTQSTDKNSAIYSEGCILVVGVYAHTTAILCTMHTILRGLLYISWNYRLRRTTAVMPFSSQLIKVTSFTSDKNASTSKMSIVRDVRSDFALKSSRKVEDSAIRRPSTTSNATRYKQPEQHRRFSKQENNRTESDRKPSLPQFQDWDEIRRSVDNTNQRWAATSKTELRSESDDSETISLVTIRSIEW